MLKSFLRGVASVLDLGGTLAPFLDDIPTDAEAIKSDWQTVLGDWEDDQPPAQGVSINEEDRE